MKGRPYFNNFSSGELDSRQRARTDLEKYHSSVKTMKNMLGLTEGPATTRGGTRYVCTISSTVPPSSAKFLKQLRTDYESLGLLYRYTSGPTDTAEACYVTPAGGMSYMQYTITDQLLIDIANANVTASPDDDSGGVRREPGVVQLFTTFNEGTVATQSVRFNATAIQPVVTEWVFTVRFSKILDNTNSTVTVAVSETVAAVTTELASVDVVGTNVCRILVTVDPTATDLFVDVTLASEYEDAVNIISVSQSRGSTFSDTLSASECPTDVRTVRSTIDISTGRGIWMHPSVHPQLHYWTTTTAYNVNVSFTSTPAEWVADNYPTICAFYKGRSWWSGCPSNPTQIWASRVNTAVSGDWFDMTTGSLDTDSISIVRNKPGRITNIVAGSSLLVQTELDSFVLEAESGVLTPSDIYEVLQSGIGAATIDPINLGAVILYVASDRQSIMATRYRHDIIAWRDLQVNDSAMHLFRGKEISNIAYLGNEVQNVFVVFVDGTMVIGTKDPYSEKFAWSTMELPVKIADIASFYRAGQDYLFLFAYGPEASGVSVVLIYEPEYQLDCIQEYQSPVGFNSIYTNLPSSTLKLFVDDLYHAANYAMRSISDDTLFAAGTTNWSVVTGTSRVEYFLFAAGDLTIRAAGAWVSDYQPEYVLLTFIAEGTCSVTITGTSETILSTTLDPGSHIIALDWTDVTEDIYELTIQEAGGGDGGLHQLAFSDDPIALLQAQQFYRTKLDNGDLTYMGAAPFNVPEEFDFSVTNVNHIVTGCGFTQELETLTPHLPTQIGAGRTTIRGNNRVHVGILDSAVPYINGKVPVVDKNAELDNNGNVVEGYVRTTLTGYTRSMSIKANQYEPEKLEVTEIVLDITQSEDG